MLPEHLQAVEDQLLAISKIPANSGHTLHRGTPREAFVREFLQSHLSERVAIGTGEIIDAASQPRQKRNQFDIVIYKRDYPKLDFGGGINAFLAESVVATIEVKSILDRSAIEQSIGAARAAKALQRNLVQAFTTGYQPPAILNYVIAYEGPATMTTVRAWIHQTHVRDGIVTPALPPTSLERQVVPSPSLDGVFVLGKGFWYFDNVPMGLIQDPQRALHPQIKYVYCDTAHNNLLLLFLYITFAISGVSVSWLDPIPYVNRANFANINWAG